MSFAVFIVYSSIETLLTPAHRGHAAFGIDILAGTEIVAAATLATGLFKAAASMVLLVIFAIAGTVTVLEGEWPLRFVYYGATVLFLASQGMPQASKP